MAKATLDNQEIEALIAAAQEALRRGDLVQTVANYRAVLSLDPEHGLANYWLGVLALKASMPGEALPLLEIAAIQHPDQPEIHIDLGLACHALNDEPRANACFKAARELVPNYASVQISLAENFERENKPAEEIEACRRGLLLFPDDPQLLRTMADICFRRGQWSDALRAWEALLKLQGTSFSMHFAFGEQCYKVGDFKRAASAFRRVLELQPGTLTAWLNLGLVLQKLNDLQGALEAFRQALGIDPENADAYKCQGDVQRDLGQWDEAIELWRRAIERRPEHADAWQNLGLGLEQQDRFDEALACHRRVIELRPENATARRYLGMILQDLGQLTAARECYEESLRLDPNDPESHWQMFSLLAAQAEFPLAWEEHEWRWQLKNRISPKREFTRPKWNGEELNGKTVLLYAEQGFGDTIQAARYAPLVKARGGRVLLWTPPDLISVMRTVPGVSDVFSQLGPETPFDCQLPLMSLPLVFGTTLATIPNQVPYMSAPQDVNFSLPKSDDVRPKVGLVWSGSLSQPNDRRPIPFECLARLLEISDAEFYSLQKGSAGLQNVGARFSGAIKDLGPQLIDFAVTAAVIEQLDLVITVDTAVAHLAGALGKPVWVLLSFAPDWRWMLEREDNPWYPSMRLFRQTKPSDWPEVIGRVFRELTQWIGSYQKPSIVKNLLGAGLVHHQAGHLEQAEEQYRRVMQLAPRDASALRFMGVIARQQGRLPEAIEWLEKALQVEPNAAHAHHDLGLVWFALGRFEEAIKAYRKALEILPAFAEAQYNLGNTYYALKRSTEAEACYREALLLQPDLADARFNLGLLAQENGKLDDAIDEYRKTVASNPAHLDALLNLGSVSRALGRMDDAENFIRQVLAQDSENPKARINLASILVGKNELETAEQLCRDVLQKFPALAEAWLNLGVVTQALGQADTALEYFRRALDLQPNSADARYNLGIAQLLTGQLQEGWKNYEARWRTDLAIFAPRGFSQPPWKGEDLRGRTILVHAEQGLGDAIQFVRYLSLLAQRGARVILECPSSLARLFATADGVDRIIPRGEGVPDCDYQIPLMSLPFRFETTLENIPNRTPYLQAPGDVKIRLPKNSSKHFKVGLAWAGSPSHGNDQTRSIPLQRWSPILSAPQISFFSLQVGSATKELADVQSAREVIDLEPQLTDFASTAGFIAAMDLVICVDTAVAHLAGALGKTVWVLLPFAPDWRWLLRRDDSPWYPSMRLFRQNHRGDWNSVIEQVRDALLKATERI